MYQILSFYVVKLSFLGTKTASGFVNRKEAFCAGMCLLKKAHTQKCRKNTTKSAPVILEACLLQTTIMQQTQGKLMKQWMKHLQETVSLLPRFLVPPVIPHYLVLATTNTQIRCLPTKPSEQYQSWLYNFKCV